MLVLLVLVVVNFKCMFPKIDQLIAKLLINFDSIPEDRAILRHVVRDLNQAVGVYARIVTPGKVSVGDTLTFL